MADIVRTNVVRIDLANGNIVRNCNPVIIGENDAFANEFGVEVYRDGQPVDISGANVTGYFIRSNNTTVVINGGVVESGSVAKLTLPQACYAFQGQFSLAIKLTGGDVTGTLRVVYGSVENPTSGTPIDPGHVIPTLDELLAKIGEMETATAAAQAVVDEYDTKVAVQDAKIEAVETNDAVQDTAITANATAITALDNAKADKVALAHTDRVVSALVEAGKGKILRFETDDDDGYAKTVPSGALNATTTEWGGKSVVWNQHIVNGNFEDTTGTGWVVNHPSRPVTISGGVATVRVVSLQGSAYYDSQLQLSDTSATEFPSGHKIYVRADVNFPVECSINGYMFGTRNWGNTIPANTWTRASEIISSDGTGFSYISGGVTPEVNSEWKYRNIICVDLTQHYGAGSEPTTTDDPRIAAIEAYAMAHPEFNAGEIVNADVVSIDTAGKNLYTGWGNTFPIGIGTYYYSSADTTGCTRAEFVFYDGNGNPVTDGIAVGGAGVVTTFFRSSSNRTQLDNTITVTNANVKSMKIHGGTNAYPEYADVQVEVGSSKTEYKPYHAPVTHPIPSSVLAQYPLRSAGSVYDTISWDGSKWWHTKRCSELDIGSLNYTASETDSSRYTTTKPSGMKSVANNVIMSQTSVYTAIKGDTAIADYAMAVRIVNTSTLQFRNSAYTDATAFKTAMDGVMLNYELATPVVTDITDLMGDAGTDLIAMAVESGGTLTFAQANGTIFPVPNTIEYTVKISEVE